VRSEQRSSETSKNNSTRPAGVVGVTANIGTPAAATAGTTSNSETAKEQESVQYEVGRVVERRTLVAGGVKRLSVAVLVDPPYKMTPGPNGAEQKVPVPRDKAELEKIRASVMRAVGFSAARGDEVDVAELVFDTSVVERERTTAERVERQAYWWSTARQGAVGVGLLLLGFFALRTLLALLRRRPTVGTRLDLSDAALAESGGGAQLTPKTAAALNPAQILKGREREALQGRVAALVRANPEQMAQIIRSWMVTRRS
jgi:flagellar M-ring protein FliF